MPAIASAPTVKLIGANGQISLGKQFAGRQLLIEQQEAGVWPIRTATIIPDSERWLHEAKAAAELALAIAWSSQNSASDSQTDAVLLNVAPDRDSTYGAQMQPACRFLPACQAGARCVTTRCTRTTARTFVQDQAWRGWMAN